MDKVRLAFSGSGFLAPIHAGAAAAFMDQHVDIVEVAGTSGGSIVAACVAAGLGAVDLHRIATSPIPAAIMDTQLWTLIRPGKPNGKNDGKLLLGWLRAMIGYGNTRFKDCQMPVTIMASDIEPRATGWIHE